MTFNCVSDKMAHATCMQQSEDNLQESILPFLAKDVNEHKDQQLGIMWRIKVFEVFKPTWDIYTTYLSRNTPGSSGKRE